MKHIILSFALVLFLIQSSVAKTIIVDKFGLGQYTTIQAGVNAALVGDTVKVYPGVYNEQINLGKDIVLQGSGYEYTQIVADASPALSMSTGKVMWFAISSNSGIGVGMTGGILTNCVVWNSPDYGIQYQGATLAKIENCIVVNNGSRERHHQIAAESKQLSVLNTIVWTFPSGHSRDYIDNYYGTGILYCRTYYVQGTGGTNANPQFPSTTDFKITGASPCWNTGKPDIYDPDGSRSDMGYYGGPDAPIFPIVSDLRIFLNPDGTVSVQATAQSRY